MTFFEMLAIFGQTLTDPPTVQSPEAKQFTEAMRIVFWVLVSLVSIGATIGGAVVAWFKAITPGARALAEWYRKERAKDQAQKHAFALREQERLEAKAVEATMRAGLRTQRAMQASLDGSAAHYVLVFQTHNGDGIPKPTTQINSTATLEAAKYGLKSIQDSWTAQPVDLPFLEKLIAANAKPGEAIVIDASTLPESQLKDRLAFWEAGAAIVIYIDLIDGLPTFMIALYSCMEKATTGMARVITTNEAAVIKRLSKDVAARRAKLDAITAQVLKTFDITEEAIEEET